MTNFTNFVTLQLKFVYINGRGSKSKVLLDDIYMDDGPCLEGIQSKKIRSQPEIQLPSSVLRSEEFLISCQPIQTSRVLC